jgi:predicted 3-demethylubiquinone-9 3-methyltransferase (glyoxalase superfamily)
MTIRAHPFLMFQGGVAREAMEFYVSLFDDGEIVAVTAYGPDGPGVAGTIMRATFRVAGQEFGVSDSYVSHAFDFTPSMSIWIETDAAGELDRLFAALGAGGDVLMPVADYGFSARFGWLTDRFGVSWQLNLV